METNLATIPHGTNLALAPVTPAGALLQPVGDVRLYLANRRKQAVPQAELHLLITLPKDVRDEALALWKAFGFVRVRVREGASVSKACAGVMQLFSGLTHSPKRFRALYDEYTTSGDWTVLVDKAKAGALWQKGARGLPPEFLEFCAMRLGEYEREDGKRQAVFSLIRQWRTGRNQDGIEQAMPGYGKREIKVGERTFKGGYWRDWFKANCPGQALPDEAPIPEGWSYENILKQIKKQNLFKKSVRALLHEGVSAAREFTPGVNGTREGLRFMELIEFDDVRMDWRVMDPDTGEIMDLWLLIARDKATTMVLGFGLRPARAREDGSQQHLALKDMKQLVGWVLEQYGLPPYKVWFKIEHGTATLSAGTVMAMGELCCGRIDVSYSAMIGGNSPAGYKERGLGNSRGKASLESLNRLGHTMLSHLPGQIGRKYEVRRADLKAREDEAKQIFEASKALPQHLRSSVAYPFLTIPQARAAITEMYHLQNNRTDHQCEGFETVLEWWDGKGWRSQCELPAEVTGKIETRVRKESPTERAMRLIGLAGGQWTRVSPDIITAFYEHLQRKVRIEETGEITFWFEDRQISFVNPGKPLPPLKNLLGYLHPNSPDYLHLTDGRGAVLGTWLRKGLVRHGDQEALQRAIRYAAEGLAAAKAEAHRLAAGKRGQLDDMRTENARLMLEAGLGDFTGLAEAQPQVIDLASPVAAALASKMVTEEDLKREKTTRTRTIQNDEDAADAAMERAMQTNQ